MGQADVQEARVERKSPNACGARPVPRRDFAPYPPSRTFSQARQREQRLRVPTSAKRRKRRDGKRRLVDRQALLFFDTNGVSRSNAGGPFIVLLPIAFCQPCLARRR
jgi:hypothetical protein